MPTEPPQPGDELHRRLDELDARLARLEARLGVDAERSEAESKPQDAGPGASDAAAASGDEITPSERKAAALSRLAHAADVPHADTKAASEPQAQAGGGGGDAPPGRPAETDRVHVQPKPPQPKAPMAPKRPTKKPVSLEELIGGKLFAVVGPLIVLAGLAFGVKVAWDAGWLRLSETARCLGVAGFGAVLLVAGELTRKRLGRAASGSMTTVGIGAMYVAAWAAYGLFELVPAGGAFAMMAIVAVGGLALSLRAGLPIVAILSLLGGYAAPLLARASSPSPVALPVYVVTLTTIGLALSAWRPKFVSLRTACWWAGGLVATVWLLLAGYDEPFIALAFTAAMWGLFHAELIISTRHAQPEERARWLRFGTARPLIASLSTTAWAAAWLAFAFDQMSGAALNLGWMGPAGLAVACAMLWLVLAGGLGVLRDRPETARERLGVIFACEFGALIVVAVALGVSGWMEAVSWIAMGVGACFAARWLAAPAVVWYGYAVLALATGRILTYDLSMYASAPGYAMLGLELSGWSALVIGLGVGWCAAGLLSIGARSTVGWVFAQIAIGLGVLLAALFVAHENTTATAVAVVWSLVGLAAFVGFRAMSPPSTDRLKLIGGQIGGWVVLGIGVLAALFTEWFDAEITQRPLGLVITKATVAPFAVGAAMVAAAWIGRRILVSPGSDATAGRQRLSIFGLGNFLGVTLLLGAAGHIDAEPVPLVALYALAAAGLVLADRIDRALATAGVAAVAWCGAAFAWTIGLVPDWLDGDQTPLLHAGLWVGVLMAAVVPWIGRAVAFSLPPSSSHAVRGVAWAAGVLVLFTATSLEVARSAGIWFRVESVERGALSIWWTVFGVGLVVAGSLRRVAAARYAGLAIMAVAGAKVLLFDLVGLSPAVRAVSFIVVGLLFVAVAAGYLRLRKSGSSPADDHSDERPDEDPPPPGEGHA